ncbi:MAG TPA: pitrilysin family protein [Anaeromyxobacter sp.]|nr:pitrilysin family protein [Anaeromyxobacter sp.]
MPLRFAAAVAAALLAGSFSAYAGAAEPPETKIPHLDFQLFRLENGLTVVLHQDRTVPLVGVHVEYNVGSKDEKPHLNGFAHLFEHLMFEGTEHLPKGVADRLLTAAGASGNGATAQDSTVYWEQAPSNALDLLLYVESERMGWLLPTLDQKKLDNQREVVLNELRQNYQMRPYGMAYEKLMAALWDPAFPYHWLPIGTEKDVEAATLPEVRDFFQRFYGPGNAVLAVAGDFDPGEARRLVEKWFGGIPSRDPPARPPPEPLPLTAEKRVTMEDNVQLPRLYLAWQTPQAFAPGDAALDVLAEILAEGKSARLVDRLEMRERIAQGVSAGQSSLALAGNFLIVATSKPGIGLERLEREIDQEIARIAEEPPTPLEVERARNKIEAAAVFGLEAVGGSGGRAATLANYTIRTGDPGYLEQDLARYRSLTPADVSAAARTYLRKDARVVLEVVPGGGGTAGPTPESGGEP